MLILSITATDIIVISVALLVCLLGHFINRKNEKDEA